MAACSSHRSDESNKPDALVLPSALNSAAGFEICHQLTLLTRACLYSVNSSGQTAQRKCHETNLVYRLKKHPEREKTLKFKSHPTTCSPSPCRQLFA